MPVGALGVDGATGPPQPRYPALRRKVDAALPLPFLETSIAEDSIAGNLCEDGLRRQRSAWETGTLTMRWG